MEITRQNFPAALELFRESIASAAFVSIDGEFTGLSNGKTTLTALDSPKMRYLKLKESGAVDFLMMQIGVCAFELDSTTDSYLARPFNVFVFPRPFGRAAPDARFLCQTSSIDFLTAQNFDFNKAFKEGVSYLPLNVYHKLKDELVEKRNDQRLLEKLQLEGRTPSTGSSPMQPLGGLQGINPIVEIPEEHKSFVEGILQKIEEFLGDETKKTLDFDPCNGFQRKLIFQTVSQKHAAVVQAETKINTKKDRFVSLTKADEEEKRRLAEEKHKEKLKELDDSLGFTHVLRDIASSGKVLVGHNMFLDLLHILHDFVSPDLPEDYDEFKSLAHETFPRVVDTKVLASNLPFKEMIIDHSLGPLRNRLMETPFKPPKIRFPDGFDRYDRSKGTDDDGPLHEAGYDAYITGLCFATMVGYLQSFLDPPETLFSADSKILAPYINKLHLMRSSPDLSYLSLDGPDLDPARDHVFHLTFPKDWKAPDIFSLFRQFGQIMISWIDETSAFITLKDKDFRAQAAKHFYGGTGIAASKTYTVIPFAQYLDSFMSRFDSPRSANADEIATTPQNSRKRNASQAELGSSNGADGDTAAKRAKALEKSPYSWTKQAVTAAKTKAKEFLARALATGSSTTTAPVAESETAQAKASLAKAVRAKEALPPVKAAPSKGSSLPKAAPALASSLSEAVPPSRKRTASDVDEGEIISEGEEGELRDDDHDDDDKGKGSELGRSPVSASIDDEPSNQDEMKKKKTGKAAKNSAKRFSLRRKKEREKAFESKVKLFEEDDEWK